MTTTASSDAALLGALMAQAEFDTPSADVPFLKAASETAGALGAPVLCALGAAIFDLAGDGTTFEASLYKSAAEDAPDNPLVERLGNIVLHLCKEAGVTGISKNVALPLFTRSIAFTPDVLKVVLGGGLLAGGTLGTLAYGAKRMTERDDDKNEELKARVAYYRQLADELRSRTATAGITER